MAPVQMIYSKITCQLEFKEKRCSLCPPAKSSFSQSSQQLLYLRVSPFLTLTSFFHFTSSQARFLFFFFLWWSIDWHCEQGGILKVCGIYKRTDLEGGKDKMDGEVHGVDSRRPVVMKKGSLGLMEVEKRVGETNGCRQREWSKPSPLSLFSVCPQHLTAGEMVRWRVLEAASGQCCFTDKDFLPLSLPSVPLTPVFLQWCLRMIESSPTDSIFKQTHQ